MGKKKTTPTTENIAPVTALAERPPTDLEPWEVEAMADRERVLKQESGVGGMKFFKTKAGILKNGDSVIESGKLYVVVVDSIIAKTYYATEYDADESSPPTCYSFEIGKLDDAKPHADVLAPHAPTCAECRWNKFYTANKGKGKACSDRRQLALVAAGTMQANGVWLPFTDPKQFDVMPHGLSLSPTQLSGWAAYATGIIQGGEDLAGVITEITVKPSEENLIAVTFQRFGAIGRPLRPILHQKKLEARRLLTTPYPKADEKPAKSEGKAKSKGKEAPKGKGKKAKGGDDGLDF